MTPPAMAGTLFIIAIFAGAGVLTPAAIAGARVIIIFTFVGAGDVAPPRMAGARVIAIIILVGAGDVAPPRVAGAADIIFMAGLAVIFILVVGAAVAAPS